MKRLTRNSGRHDAPGNAGPPNCFRRPNLKGPGNSPNLKANGHNLRDPKVLEDILGSRPEIDWENTPASKLRKVNFNHPAFSGNIVTLIHRTFGVPNRVGGQLNSAEDIRAFLWYAIEGRMIEADNRRLEVVAGFDGNIHAANPLYSSGESVPDRKELGALVGRLLESLTPRQRQVLKLTFWERMSRKEISKAFGISQERVRQLEEKALEKLGEPETASRIRAFTERDPPQEFNPRHAHIYELAWEERHQVRLVRSDRHYKWWERPKVKLTPFLRKYFEKSLEALLNQLQRAENWGEAERILRKSGFAGAAAGSQESVGGLISDEMEKITGHRMEIRLSRELAFREI